jgi:hypothetical protein
MEQIPSEEGDAEFVLRADHSSPCVELYFHFSQTPS